MFYWVMPVRLVTRSDWTLAFFFSSRRRHTRFDCDWSSDVCSSDLASGVAVLLGVADALKAKPPTLGVDLLFVDGEDYGNFATDSTDVLIGSRYFAAHQPPGYQPLFAVLFDMVADKDQQFYYEGNSQAFAPEVVDRVWRVAAELGYGRVFVPGVRTTLTDDHVALQKAGIHAIDE